MGHASRSLVRRRAGERCEYCHVPEAAYSIPFHVEHIVATVHARNDDPSNLAWACPRCNAYKGPNLVTIDPETSDRVEVFNPRIHRWEEHFRLAEGSVVGLTAVGRGTLRLLQMNEPQRVELRRLF